MGETNDRPWPLPVGPLDRMAEGQLKRVSGPSHISSRSELGHAYQQAPRLAADRRHRQRQRVTSDGGSHPWGGLITIERAIRLPEAMLGEFCVRF
jgi:hypothetical protein